MNPATARDGAVIRHPASGPGALARARGLALLVLLALFLGACGSGDECDTCSSDEDCNGGFICATFSDGSRRCGSGTGDTECRVR
jgi:hypothetical protein